MIEATRRWNALTVQFHPEYRPDAASSQQLFGTLRRSWAFFFADQLRSEGKAVTVEAIAQRYAAKTSSCRTRTARGCTTIPRRT